ncbi:hypothetical protein N7E01_07200 [Neopusillimonas aromaticivorans]|nr:hypothetical protein [Neopusillimonas aromaticivorans]WJJ94685.1 hypothetical protein N7E01_07200 [Neopusillimonas aromaticivorans]
MRFAANIDGHAMAGALAGLDPHETLVVVASKSFTTTETLQNAARALEWLKGPVSATLTSTLWPSRPDRRSPSNGGKARPYFPALGLGRRPFLVVVIRQPDHRAGGWY